MSSQSPSPLAVPARWPELDLFRALACVAMIANHAGVLWLESPPPDTLHGVVTFAGGLAPVFFFTVTGMGRGLGSHGPAKSRPFLSTLRKAMVLLLADAALWLGPERLFGLDFLGFIGLSAVVLDLVCRSRHPRAVALSGLLLVVAARFFLSPLLDLPPGGGPGMAAIHWVLGDAGLPGISYPVGPWLAYPFIGFLLASFASKYVPAYARHSTRIAGSLFVLGLVGYGASALLAHRGFVFFRWGTMSFGYFVLSGAAVLTALALVVVLPRSVGARAQDRMALPGASSFIVVPLHYGLIHLVALLPIARLATAFVPLVVGCTVVSFAAARALEGLMRQIVSSARGAWLENLCLAATVVLLVPLALGAGGAQRLGVMVAAQLAACMLFIVVSRRRVAPASPPVVGEGAPASR